MHSARQQFDRKILGVIVGVGLVFLGWIAWQAGASTFIPTPIRFENVTIAARVAKSAQAKEQGLSGTKSLANETGMLFVYDQEDMWQIWMRDMRYPIDIIWLDKDKKVVYIVHGAKPSSYPKTVFTPKKPAQYVLEIPAGAAKRHGIGIGVKAEFRL